jgi:hypothetical protein
MKMNRLILGGLGFSVPLALVLTTGCEDRFRDCVEGFNCKGDGEGPQSGGTSPGGDDSGGSSSGGAKSGGASNSGGATHAGGSNTGGVATSGGMGGEAAGGAPPKPCDGKCKGDTPFCDEGDKDVPKDDTCVACLKQADCKEPTMPMCLVGACVPCKDDFSCTDTLGLTDAPVCLNGAEDGVTDEVRPDTGECVECGTSSDCGGAICDAETLTCIEGTSYKGKGLCDACTDDRECKDGQLCVEMEFSNPTLGVVGSFCQWRKDAALPGPAGTCGINSQPYATSAKMVSANGVEADICTLATTTCPALKQHRTAVAGCEVEFVDDDACGVEGFNDGKCRLDGNSDPKCTYRCGGPEDCDGFTCFDTGSEKYCAL